MYQLLMQLFSHIHDLFLIIQFYHMHIYQQIDRLGCCGIMAIIFYHSLNLLFQQLYQHSFFHQEVLKGLLVSLISLYFKHQGVFFHNKINRLCSSLLLVYVCIFFLFHLESETIRCAVKTQIMTTRKHQNILRQTATFCTRLRIHIF